ncbi:MAG: hypothetical protein K2N78_06450 [Oscillospiraceae bacterium]|nr:hypothetical protein [Oscillospiraceae bacterium]
MKKIMVAMRLWLAGAVLFALRLVQLRTGFDPATGLALPSPAGTSVWVGLLLCLAVEAALCFRRPGGHKRSYVHCFGALEGPGLLAAGSFLLIAGGALLLVSALPPQDAVAFVTIVAGLLGAAGGAGLLLLARELRGGEVPSVFPLLPVMFFSVLFLLSVYFPEESNPVLQQFYLQVLAAAMAGYFLYQLSGFFRREGSLRWFGLAADLAVIVCVAAAADCLHEPGRLLTHLGFAVVATVFLLLRRTEPLPEEPVKAEKAENP